MPPLHSQTLKEALTNTGADHPEMNGSLSDGGASFVVSMPFKSGYISYIEAIYIGQLQDLWCQCPLNRATSHTTLKHVSVERTVMRKSVNAL